MMVSAHQLHYLPWLRYVDKIAQSDLFILLDDVQFTVNGWQNRSRIKGPSGPFYLTVPVRHPFSLPLSAVEIAEDTAWRRKHRRALQINYSKAKWYYDYGPTIERLYDQSWHMLNDLSWAMLGVVLDALGVATPIVRASTLNIGGRGSERLAAMCRSLGADTYLTGAHAITSHLDLEPFARSGIQVIMQDWRCPSYRQRHSDVGFSPDLSIVDLLFNEGSRSLEILRTGSTLRRFELAEVRR